MAVNKAPVRQQSYLTEYDRQMAEYLRGMSGGIGAQDIAAEAYGGKFPVGTMTAKILSGVLAGASDRRAMNREDQAKKAQIALLTGAQEYATPLPTKFEGAGKFTDARGNFTQELAPAYQGVTEDANKAAFDARMLKKYYPEGVLAGGATPPGEVAVATVNGPRSQFEVAGGADLQVQPEPEIIPSIEPERKQLYPQETIKGMNIAGSKDNPNWFDRTFKGDIGNTVVNNEIELAQLAGYDPLEYLTFKQQKQTVGHEILTVAQAEKLGIKNASSMIGENSFLQQDLKTGKISLVNAGGNKTEVKIDMSTGDKYGDKKNVELFGEARDKSRVLLNKTQSNIQGAENLIYQLEQGSFSTGAFAPLKQFMLSYGEELGLLTPELRQELIGLESFGADANQIVLSFIKTLGRNPTDLDLTFMIKTLPSTNKTEEANLYILQSRMAVDKATRELLDWEQMYIDNKAEGGRDGGGILVGNDPFAIADFNKARRLKKKEISEKTNLRLEEINDKYKLVSKKKIGEEEKSIQWGRDKNGIVVRLN